MLSAISGSGAALLLALFAAAAALLAHPFTRNLIVKGVHGVLLLARSITALVARAFDAVVGIMPVNGRPRRPTYVLFVTVSVAVVAASIVINNFREGTTAADIAGITSVAFAVVNLLFLLGAYWALRENVDIMNGDKAYRRHQFADLSTAKNLGVVITVAILVMLQLAAMLQWLEQTRAVDLIDFPSGQSPSYVDYLIATANVLPFTSLLVSAAGVADEIIYVPGIGIWCAKLLNAIASILIVSTIIGFVQQDVTFRGIITGLLRQTKPELLDLLRSRLLRSPAVMKSYLRTSFLNESDDGNRLTLIGLALARHSYSFPETFIRAYSTMSDRVKGEGAPQVASFIFRKGHQFEGETLRALVEAVRQRYASKAFLTPKDKELAGNILVPTFEWLYNKAGSNAAELKAIGEMVRQRQNRALLAAAVKANQPETRDRAAGLLTRGRAKEAFATVVRHLQYMTELVRAPILEDMKVTLADRGLSFARSEDSDPVADLIRAIDWNFYNVTFGERSSAALRDIRASLAARGRLQKPPVAA